MQYIALALANELLSRINIENGSFIVVQLGLGSDRKFAARPGLFWKWTGPAGPGWYKMSNQKKHLTKSKNNLIFDLISKLFSSKVHFLKEFFNERAESRARAGPGQDSARPARGLSGPGSARAQP